MTSTASGGLAGTGAVTDGTAASRTIDAALLAKARQAYALMARRRQLLGDRLFFDPAWNMLLDLFISESTGRRLSVTAICIGSQCSAATALRYAAALAKEGLISRTADASDGRRSYVHLTDRGWDVMGRLLQD